MKSRLNNHRQRAYVARSRAVSLGIAATVSRRLLARVLGLSAKRANQARTADPVPVSVALGSRTFRLLTLYPFQ